MEASRMTTSASFFASSRIFFPILSYSPTFFWWISLVRKKADKQSYNESDNGYHYCIQWDPLIYLNIIKGVRSKGKKED